MSRLSRYAVGVTAITVAGLAARLLLLGHQPLWRDEAFSAIVSGRPLGTMLDAVRVDSAPPLGYLVTHLLASWWPGAAGLRLGSALAGAAAIPIAAALGRRIAGDRGGLFSATLCAVAPALLLAARDTRMYALATTLVLAATLALWRAVDRSTPGRWLAYAALTALAVHTEYFALIAVAAQLIAVATALRPGVRRWLTACVAGAAGCASLIPWLIAARMQFAHASAPFWVPPLSFKSAGGELVQMLSGPPVDSWVPALTALRVIQGIAVGAAVAAALGLAMGWRRLAADTRRAAGFCLACGGVAILLFVPLSLWRPLVDGRYASVVWGPLFPVLGAGLALIADRRIAAGLLATSAVASIALSAVVTHPDTPAAVAALQREVAADGLVDAYPSQYLLLLYYGDASLAARTHIVSRRVDWFWGTAAYPPGAVIDAVPPGVSTVYFLAQPDDPRPPAQIAPGYRRRGGRCWTGVCVTTYSRATG